MEKVYYPNLLAEMAKRKISQSALAEKIGLSSSQISQRINCIIEFDIVEMYLIKLKVFPDLSLDYLFYRTKFPDNLINSGDLIEC